jgi:CRP-like cAMP-binding protein
MGSPSGSQAQTRIMPGMSFLPPHFASRRRRPDVGPVLDVPALREAPGRHLMDLAPHADRLHLPAGRVIARAGHTARELIVVLAGQAALLSQDGRTAAVLSAGAEIGGHEVVERSPHPATVVSLTDVEVVVVDQSAVLWAQHEGLLHLSTREEEIWMRSTSPSSTPVASHAMSS